MTSTMQPGPAAVATRISGVVTRPMTPGDLDELVRIDEATTQRRRPDFYAKRVAALAGEDRDVAVVAELDGSVVGFGFARVFEGEFGIRAPVGVLDWLGVDPPYRHLGVGHVVLAGIEGGLRSRGVGELWTQAGWHEHELVGFFSASSFSLAPRTVLDRPVEDPLEDVRDPGAEPSLEEPGLLAEDDGGFGPGRPSQVDIAPPSTATTVTVRSLAEADLPAIVRLDRLATGLDRGRYYRRLVEEALHRSGVRVSLVAEVQGSVIGVLMARVDYGEFGRAEATAVLDTIVVHPDYGGQHIGHDMLGQLLGNLRSLRVEGLRTEVDWADLPLVGFFARSGFTPAQRLSFVRSL